MSKPRNINFPFEKCYLSPDNSNIKIVHLIITRFMVEFWHFEGFTKKIYRKDYAINGIRVMKKYLFPSLENQSCKKFIWILKIGDKADINYVKSLLNLNNSFESKVIYEKNIKHYIKNISKGADILITTRIDYDDRIYYDAVNDIRKAINIHKPIILHGYNRGVIYYEVNDEYYEFNRDNKKYDVLSVFVSLIVVLKKVNDSYDIFDLGDHMNIRKKILKYYKSFGINELNYEPSIFDSGEAKFVWVRQKFSGVYQYSIKKKKNLKKYKFNLNKFYGK